MVSTKPAPNYRGEEAPTLTRGRRAVSSRQPANVFTVPELATRWAVNVKTVYAMIDRKELSVIRAGRVIRISRTVIESLESQGRVVSPGE